MRHEMTKRLIGATIAWLLLCGLCNAAIYQSTSLQAWSTTLSWYVFFQHAENPALGYRQTMTKAGNVYCLSSLHEGIARPAWHPTQVADAVNGATRQSGGSRYYYSFDAATEYIDYNVPADGNGSDTLLYYYVGASGGAVLELVKNRGASEVVLGEIATAYGSTTYDLTGTISSIAPALVAGDKISIRRKAGETGTGRFQHLMTYEAAGIVTSFGRTFWIPTLVQVDDSGTSSKEFAYCVAPSGQTPKWTGGAAHQGGANCTEINPVVSYTRNGAAWTPIVGWTNGDFTLHRTTDVDYDGGPTVIGALNVTYTFGTRAMSVENLFTAAVDLDLSPTRSLYLACNDGSTDFTWAIVQAGKTWEVVPTTATDDSETALTTSRVPAARGVYLGMSPQKALAHLIVNYHSHPWDEMFFWHRSTGPRFYFHITPASTVAGTTWGSKWTWEFTNTVSANSQPHVLILP